MSYVSSEAVPGAAAGSRPLIKGLFVATCLLSIVSWYTTQQGMALYLSSWFAVLASLGIQTALVLVAWLIGFTPGGRRALLIVVYAMTAAVSIAFSYVSLYNWFWARARPAAVQRRLYDTLQEAAGQAQGQLAAALAEAQKHALALEEMTAAEKSHGWISRAQDADPYLARIREAVAREAQSYDAGYREGSGQGLRYTAFERYARLARQSIAQMETAQRGLADFRGQVKPLDRTEKQLRAFRQASDAVPWVEVEAALHGGRIERPAAPAYADYVDQTVSGQEDLLLAFEELVSAPTGRHLFAFALAAFIDVIVFLVAYASGPYFFGSSEQRWLAGSAALDGRQEQVFVRDFLRKLGPGPGGAASVVAADLSPGEKQLCVLLAAKGQAAAIEQEGRRMYLLGETIHQTLLEMLSAPSLPLRASTERVPSEA